VDAIGETGGQLHAGHAAHGEPAEVDTIKGEGVEEMNNVATELGDGVWTGRDRGLAMAAGVVAENAKLLGEVGELRIPHAEIGAERIGEENDGSVGGAVELVTELRVGESGEGHVGGPQLANLFHHVAEQSRYRYIPSGLN